MIHSDWSERTKQLLGQERVNEYQRARVLVVGLGGVGGVATEMLVRAGIGHLTIVDADIIQPSNINRQIVATSSQVGRPKASVLAERLRDINPEVHIEVVEEFLQDENTVEVLRRHRYDFVVDAIDSLSPKVHLIRLCREFGLPIISSMGAGAKRNPALVQQGDLSRSYNCNLARALRKRLRKHGITKGIPVVFSSELADCEAIVEVTGERCKRSTAGTISYMPATFGIHIAHYVLEHILPPISE